MLRSKDASCPIPHLRLSWTAQEPLLLIHKNCEPPLHCWCFQLLLNAQVNLQREDRPLPLWLGALFILKQKQLVISQNEISLLELVPSQEFWWFLSTFQDPTLWSLIFSCWVKVSSFFRESLHYQISWAGFCQLTPLESLFQNLFLRVERSLQFTVFNALEGDPNLSFSW